MDNPRLNILSLCSGVAGIELGLRIASPGSRVVAYCERDPFAASVLLARMEDETLEPAPIWCGDLELLDWSRFRGVVDVVTAGFPCQPWSAAGKGEGLDDERWLWPAIAKCIRDVGPSVVFLENVPGLASGGGLGHVLGDLASRGYDAEWGVFGAWEIGAPHKRDRLFILAWRVSDPHLKELWERAKRGAGAARPSKPGDSELGDVGEEVADSNSRSIERVSQLPEDGDAPHRHDADGCGAQLEHPLGARREGERPAAGRGPFPPGADTPASRWPADVPQPAIRRGPDGPPSRVDRLRCIGNGVVPQVAALAWRELWRRA